MTPGPATADATPAPRSRDRDRRGKIVTAATHLFREKGFHAVGIDEVGTAAGITGPGVYRHFAGKDELLVAVLREATEDMWLDDGELSLDDYVRHHVDFAVAHTETIQLWHQEGRNLPEGDQQAQRGALFAYVERWAEALLTRRPELSRPEARIRVRATIGLIHASSHAQLEGDADVLAPILERMALAALLA